MAVITAGLKKLIEDNVLALATTGKGKRPHVIAVAYCKVFGDKIIISNSHIKESIKNLDANNNVSISVWHKDWEKVCIGFELTGKAKNIKSGKWFEFVKNMPENKGYNIKSAIVVNILKAKKLQS